MASQVGIAIAAGGRSAGATVTTPYVRIPAMPGRVSDGDQSQACFANVTGKTSSGFNVVLTPAYPGGVNATLSAGTFDVSGGRMTSENVAGRLRRHCIRFRSTGPSHRRRARRA